MKGTHREAAAHGLGVLDDPEAFEAHLRGCARCRVEVTEFRPVAEALAHAARLGYLPPDYGAARRRKACGFSGRRGSTTGPLVLLALGMAVTALCAARPATARIRFASTASIVSPAQVVAGTGHAPRDLPWAAGFQ